ncbi:putative calcium channel [Penaeus vannamei]|uniref:Putative calcium channel n=1 Tax=Penaeus vannamei TaxID=6689 RepID=A0A423SF74_PENVA|nr:putative calcium channel [Penaeus vannamei]
MLVTSPQSGCSSNSFSIPSLPPSLFSLLFIPSFPFFSPLSPYFYLFQDILKPNYNSVDFAEVELIDHDSGPRSNNSDLLELRRDLIDQREHESNFSVKIHMDNMKRVVTRQQRYFTQRVKGTPFSLGIAMPMGYGKYKVYGQVELPSLFSVTDYFTSGNWSIHPDWVYCEYKYDQNRPEMTPEELMMDFLTRAQEPRWKWRSTRTRAPPEPSMTKPQFPLRPRPAPPAPCAARSRLREGNLSRTGSLGFVCTEVLPPPTLENEASSARGPASARARVSPSTSAEATVDGRTRARRRTRRRGWRWLRSRPVLAFISCLPEPLTPLGHMTAALVALCPRSSPLPCFVFSCSSLFVSFVSLFLSSFIIFPPEMFCFGGAAQGFPTCSVP